MPNPIQHNDLLDSKAISDIIAQFEAMQSSFEQNVDRILKKAKEMEAGLKNVNIATEQGRKKVIKVATETEKLEREQRKYQQAMSDNAKAIIKLKEEQKKLNRVNKLTLKFNESAEGSYDKLSAQYSLIKIKLNAMSDAQRKTTKEGQALEQQSKAIYEQMEDLQEATGKGQLSVGKYSRALGPLADGFNSASSAAKAFIKNPIVLTISLIVGGITALFGAFTKSEKGADLMAKATGILNGILSQGVKLAVLVAEKIEFAFSNPQQAIKNLGQSIFDGIIKRLKGGLDLVLSFGQGLKALVKRDIEGLKKASDSAGTALAQMISGLDTKEQKEFGEAIKETTKEILNEVNAFGELESMKRKVIKSNRQLSKTIENLTTKEQTYQAIADDTTKSFKERESAAENARIALEQRAAKEIQLARNNLSIINQELNLRRSNGEMVEDLLDRQLGAYRELRAAERELTLGTLQNERERSELKQDRLERDLDILIDGFDNQKTINERLVKDETLTFEKRQSLLRKTRELSDDSFQKQIETIQKFTGVAVNANELIAESDAVTLNEKIRALGLSEIIEGRLLEIVRERKLVNIDLAEAQQDLTAATKKASEEQVKSIAKAQTKATESALKEFGILQDLEESKFKLIKSTEKEKDKFRIEQEIARQEKLLELNLKFGKKLGENEIQTIKNTIKALKNEIGELDEKEDKPKDLFDLLGFDFGDKKNKEALKTSLDFAKNQLNQFAEKRTEIANQNVQNAANEIQAAQAVVAAEMKNREGGFAHNVELAQKEFVAAKENQRKALKEQEKAQKQQIALQAVQQSSNLITGVSKIYADVKFPFSLIASAIMIGSFIASKAKAFQAVKKKNFAEGGYTVLAGGRHGSGNDTNLGFTTEGKQAYGEQGEGVAVFKRASTSKYSNVIPQIVKRINDGTFENHFQNVVQYTKEIPLFAPNVNIDNKGIISELKAIRADNKKEQYFTDAKGRLVRIRGNVKTTYV